MDKIENFLIHISNIGGKYEKKRRKYVGNDFAITAQHLLFVIQ